MTPIAPHLTAFFRERLPLQRGASPHTCESYAYSFQLLLEFASDRLNVTPSKLYLEQLDAALVMEFLAHLEEVRDNGPRTRDARLAAIKSFMRARTDFFSARPDKEWSLTDCISFVVMNERGITDALTSDHHFEQAGFQILLKD